MSRVGSIIRMVAADRRKDLYAAKNRLIAPGLYNELKALKKCQHCGGNVKRPEIHHVVPVRLGGSNERENLLALCHSCHTVLDRGAL